MDPIEPKVTFETCPIRASLGVLGHKWTLLVLRDVAALRGEARFNAILRRNKGLTPRMLSKRLAELTKAGIVARSEDPEGEVRYALTKDGEHVWPILTAFIQYGMKHQASTVFADRRPRSLSQVFPGRQDPMLGELRGWATARR